MLMDNFLPKFDIYQGAVAIICFESYTNSSCPVFFFFSKKNLSRAGSELHRVRRNIVSAEESVRG